jgi:peptidoglycan/xylan/chitin deacetylase (PgdA/CDA1 family)
MKAITILYHDVVNEERWDESGFLGPDANLYKLERKDFEAHLNAIESAISQKPTSVQDRKSSDFDLDPLILTFDDGGGSAYPLTADLLDARKWIGHFLITADYVDKTGFVTKEHIRELRKRGHVIGSHSCTHPPRMSACARQEIFEEWDRSIGFLSDILGEPVHVASVPGGHFSNRVARAAAEVGIKFLFISEPTVRSRNVEGCEILGRYTIWRGMGPEVSGGIAAGRFGPRWKQWLWWNTKKLAKTVGGEHYLKIRRALLKDS